MADVYRKLGDYLATITDSFPQKIRAVLAQIDDSDRRLLAIRGYLRTKRNIETDWAWNNVQADAFRKSAASKALADQIALVTSEFEDICATARPGKPAVTLKTAKTVRSLETQIDIWNRAPSVRTTGGRLLAMALAEVQGPFYGDLPRVGGLADGGARLSLPVSESLSSQFSPQKPGRGNWNFDLNPSSSSSSAGPSLFSYGESVQRFKSFLKRSSPGPISAATPGLSDHGQANAIDFTVVTRAGVAIATANASTISAVWEKPGWAKWLKQATVDSGSDFVGPLGSPELPSEQREPWHYVIHLKTNSLEIPVSK